jgi:prepilin-type N-terminal cleavage/methylation domain-containing protein
MKAQKKGFTLVELMVVIVIIGILAALVIPKFVVAANRAKAAEFKPLLRQIYVLQYSFHLSHDRYSSDVTGLEIGFKKPDVNVSRFDYSVLNPAKELAGAENSLGTASPNVIGQKIRYDGQNFLVASDHACVDVMGVTYASAALSKISGVDADNKCP